MPENARGHMDATRYIVALLVIVVYPPAFSYWLLVHPLIRFWRRLGLVRSYAIILPILGAFGVGIYCLRGQILAIEYGTNRLLIAFAAVLLSLSIVIEIRCKRQLALLTLVGIPELRPGGSPGRLLNEGIYAQIRHPRYVGAVLGLLAIALFVNYLAIYILFAVFLPMFHLITVLEERELLDRFGAEYRQYQRRVPRFIPRRFV